MILKDQFLQDAVAFCESMPKYASNGGYDIDHKVNKGRLAIPLRLVEDENILAGIKDLTDQIMSYFDNDKVVPITTDPIENLFSCLYPVEGQTMGVFKHIDPKSSNGWEHLRINFMLQSAEEGGEPLVGRRVFSVKTGQTWSLWASDIAHSALPIKGNKMRIILSIGFNIEPSYKNEVKRILPNLVDHVTS